MKALPLLGQLMKTTRLLGLLVGALLAAGCTDTPSENGQSNSFLQEVSFDPSRSYDDRLQFYQFLEREQPYPSGWADQREGIFLQTKWQGESGRDNRDASGRLFNWWSNVNWTLTTWQAEVLAQRGDLAGASIVPHEGARFALPPDVAAEAHRFYDELEALRAEVEAGALSPDADRDAQRLLRKRLWGFHVKAIKVGIERNEDELRRLPAGERDFAEAWGKSVVDILAVVNFPTDPATVGRFQTLILPTRPVRPDDYNFARPSDLPFAQRSALVGARALHRFESATGGLLRSFLEHFVDDAGREALLAEVLERAFTEDGGNVVDAILDAIDFSFSPLFSTTPLAPGASSGNDQAAEIEKLRRLNDELKRSER
jgi:hypothetical protein